MKLFRKTTIEKATIEARHFKEANDDPFWLEPYELPTEEEIREMLKEFDICKFKQNPRHDWHDAYDASEELLIAITNLLKGKR